jgi:hypothetical protein
LYPKCHGQSPTNTKGRCGTSDTDLYRHILLDVKANPEVTGFGYIRVEVEGHDKAEVSYHIQLLRDAGLLEAKSLSTRAGLDWRPIRLTHQGHEFLCRVTLRRPSDLPLWSPSDE